MGIVQWRFYCMMSNDEDTFPSLRSFSPVCTAYRWRSQSEASAFRSRILTRLRSACSVEGLEKASLANCDVVVGGSQSSQLKGKGKLSSLGKIFKPWKWRKKRTSDKFQDLSKVLERKISTRQTREELIRKGVLIADQEDAVSTETLNGHAVPSGVTEEVKVDIESPETPAEEKTVITPEADDTEAKSATPKKTAGSSKSSSQASSTTSVKNAKDGTSELTPAESKTGKKARSPQPRSKALAGSENPAEGNSSTKDQRHSRLASGADGKSVKETSQVGEGAKKRYELSAPERSQQHVNKATEETAFTENALSSDTPGDNQSTEKITEDMRNGADGEQETDGSRKQQGVNVESPEVTVIPNAVRETAASDSDSDGPILYKDEEEEDEDDEYTSSSLASKIRRRDTLAIKLGNRPSKKELEEKNILPRTSETERQELRQQIGCKLVRRLSQRPTTEELEQRNILKQKNVEEEHEAKQEIKRRLSRKLSLRPTVAELVARRILRFNEYVEVTEAKAYDRRADKPWTRLTPADKAAIRKELNEFKSKEMEVHEESKQFTRFHRP
ncbi:phosphatase and actin regulator 2 isoform X5 [Pangasianodon hypophthalmus]|uniref:phosphatase and actin regulator 2 isoform X5 n=1 Tax=Pangasianodon hypophthalmus TaxID=310915 RepID=UPI000F002706|nr:phosphatase and actin regulator 2 isoform X5 [Pangasianodon hypophthalmus]